MMSLCDIILSSRIQHSTRASCPNLTFDIGRLHMGLFNILVALSFLGTVAILAWFAYLISEYNVVYTRMREGTAKGVVVSDKAWKIILAYRGHFINDPWSIWYNRKQPNWEVLRNSQRRLRFRNILWQTPLLGILCAGMFGSYLLLICQTAILGLLLFNKLLELIGVYFIGPIPYLFKIKVSKKWQWSEWRVVANDKDLWFREEDTDFAFAIEFTYGTRQKSLEAKGGAPLDADSSFTVRINNPWLAFFEGGDDWFVRTTVLYHGMTRTYFGENEPEDLIKSARPAAASVGATPGVVAIPSFTNHILQLNDAVPELTPPVGFRSIRGVTFTDARLEVVEPGGTDTVKEQYRETWTKQYVARETAKALVLESEGKRDAEINVATGKAKALDLDTAARGRRIEMIKSYGDVGLAVAALDGITQASSNPGTHTIWANNPLGKLGEMFSNFGRSSSPTPAPTATTPPASAGGP